MLLSYFSNTRNAIKPFYRPENRLIQRANNAIAERAKYAKLNTLVGGATLLGGGILAHQLYKKINSMPRKQRKDKGRKRK